VLDELQDRYYVENAKIDETGGEILLRGWTGTSRYLSERKQRAMLVTAGVGEQVIYDDGSWPEFVRTLRPGDKAAVADLRIFGSRKALVAAAEEVEARKARLVVVETSTEIDVPTLREVDRTMSRWRGEAAMKDRKRASALGKRGAAARKKQIAAARLDDAAARAIWKDVKRYPSVEEALEYMPGWTSTTAWRRLGGGREAKPAPTKRKR
jgi:hypothetical protein